ncbi:MAG: DUF4956 domain-containing protein [Bacteroidales bacterium]|nr:DUF4956 domain-containing protein [Bacteroidales bacterium]
MQNTILGLDLFHATSFNELLLRFAINSSVILVIVRLLYYPIARRKDYLFSFTLVSTLVFLLCYLLESVELQLGFAFGMFAIFGILRFRTNQIPIKEMTYLFVLIGISVINALAGDTFSFIELVFTNLVIIIIVYGLEKLWLQQNEFSQTIIYDHLDLLVPEKRQELIEDLRKKTGLEINRFEIRRINYTTRRARIVIYYRDLTAPSGDESQNTG